MVNVIAKIHFYKEGGRKTSFETGYRPQGHFIENCCTSGMIILKDRELFYPGGEAIVEINFITRSCLGENFGVGSKYLIKKEQQQSVRVKFLKF